MKPLFLAIGAGVLSGLLVVAAMSGASIAVAYLSLVLPMPLFMAGLGLGTRAMAIAAASGTMIAMATSPYAGLTYFVLFAGPTWLAVRLALTGPKGVVGQRPEHTGPFQQEGPKTQSTFAERITGRGVDWADEAGAPPRDSGWFSAGGIVAMMAAWACGLLVLAAFMTGGLEDAVKTYLTSLADAIAAPQGEDVLREAILRATPFFPGTIAAFWAVVMLGNMSLAQGLLAKGGRNLRPSPRLREFSLPEALSWPLVLAALIALIGPGDIGYVSRNLVLILAVPYFFLGLSVVHKMAALTPLPGALLALVYLVVIFSGWFALFIAAVGILEQWVGLSNRMKALNDT